LDKGGGVDTSPIDFEEGKEMEWNFKDYEEYEDGKFIEKSLPHNNEEGKK